MRRQMLTAWCLLLVTCWLPVASAGWTSSWSYTLDEGYITTTPQTDGEHIFLRSSGFWMGEERPFVVALDKSGEEQWRHTNPNATQHDMSPLLVVKKTSGDCGDAGPSLIVGWSDGRLERLAPSNGTVMWSVSTDVNVWGITGALAMDDDHVVVPTRHGLVRVCLNDGQVNLSVTTGLGWRNGVTVVDDGFWQGDENGGLWFVDRNGSAELRWNASGHLRHAPLVVGDFLLLHVQHTANTSIMAFNFSSNESHFVAASGPSPAIPIKTSFGAVFGDGHHLTTVRCDATCWVEDRVNATTNGAMSTYRDRSIWYPINTESGGWGTVSLTSNGTFGDVNTLSTAVDTYGTAAPLFTGGRMYLGNDAGVLVEFVDYQPPSEPFVYEPTATIGGLALALGMIGTAVLARRSSIDWGWRGLSAIGLVLALVMLPDVVTQWTKEAPVVPGPVTEWNETWPDAWRDGHVFILEFEDRTLVEGGNRGVMTVEELTRLATRELDVPIEVQTTTLGPYLTAFDGVEALGWEYFVNGERVPLSMADAMLESPSIVHWRLA
ncbi:MAG: hypothetical protein DWC07_03810 [Candidatus Poseidoniales archaeon]|nr:MAG: hypothetical protein DWC07_03810 [Candidatus Poseidoniales archaeon]